jgi:hypothetical protein
MKSYATMYDKYGAYTSNCRIVSAHSKAKAAAALGVKTSQVYIYSQTA